MLYASAVAQPSLPNFLKILAHELRWKVLIALARSDYRVQELVSLLGQPNNLVSYHLKQLRNAELVHERRSSADGRDVYYSVDLGRLKEMYFSAGADLHPGLSDGERQAPARGGTLASELPPTRVLFLCTHNSARSQMAEGILRHLGGEMVEAFSAGSVVSRVHPTAVRVMDEMNIDISAQRSKHLEEYLGQSFDFVITVCDRARESCPIFPGDPERIHWSFPDPAAVEGEEAQHQAFSRTAQELTGRLRFLLSVIAKERKEEGKPGDAAGTGSDARDV